MAMIGLGGLALVYFISRPAAPPPQTIIRTIPGTVNPTNTIITSGAGVINNLMDDLFP